MIVNVMTFSIHMKHSALQRPYRFHVPPIAMKRTTAECQWAAFRQACGTGPWLHLPPKEFADFIWYIFCADEASSNWRFFAACQTRLVQVGRGGSSLSVFFPCLLHILHRTIVPLLRSGDLLNQLYRAANVLRFVNNGAPCIAHTARQPRVAGLNKIA